MCVSTHITTQCKSSILLLPIRVSSQNDIEVQYRCTAMVLQEMRLWCRNNEQHKPLDVTNREMCGRHTMVWLMKWWLCAFGTRKEIVSMRPTICDSSEVRICFGNASTPPRAAPAATLCAEPAETPPVSLISIPLPHHRPPPYPTDILWRGTGDNFKPGSRIKDQCAASVFGTQYCSGAPFLPESDCPLDLMFVKTGQYCSDDISKTQRALRRSCGNMT